jgi:dethiobiotin synthetase
MVSNKRSKILYVTGTDTDVGKTIISAALLKAFNVLSYSTVAMKPIASGCEKVNGKLFNKDALLLQSNASIDLDYDIVNPIALEPAIAPHIAAQEVALGVSVELLTNHAQKIMKKNADIMLVEGAGGWLVPLNKNETLADFAKAINASVILVVAIRLGCINHALLSVKAIEQQGLKLAGWVANLSEATEDINNNESRDQENRDQENRQQESRQQESRQQENRQQENIDTLKAIIKAPLLAITPWVDSKHEQTIIDKVSECFHQEFLKNIVNSEIEG